MRFKKNIAQKARDSASDLPSHASDVRHSSLNCKKLNFNDPCSNLNNEFLYNETRRLTAIVAWHVG